MPYVEHIGLYYQVAHICLRGLPSPVRQDSFKHQNFFQPVAKQLQSNSVVFEHCIFHFISASGRTSCGWNFRESAQVDSSVFQSYFKVLFKALALLVMVNILYTIICAYAPLP